MNGNFSRQLVVRVEESQERKLKALALASGKGMNVSAAIRQLIAAAPEPSSTQVLNALQREIGGGAQ